MIVLKKRGTIYHTLLELDDTPVAYDNGKYLRSTADGTEWATASGGGSSTFVGLTDTPEVYDDGKYLQSTTSGTEWVSFDTNLDGGVASTVFGIYEIDGGAAA